MAWIDVICGAIAGGVFLGLVGLWASYSDAWDRLGL